MDADDEFENALLNHFGQMLNNAEHSDNEDIYLKHFGVKGMKWGQRKTNREARKDAKEFARAKMFYGDGAGNRRKLIKATVDAKSKKDPVYAKAFQDNLQSQDLGKHASKARSERKRKDTGHTVAKTGRGIKNLVMQNGAPVTITAAALFYAGNEARKRGVHKTVAKYSKTKYSDAALKAKAWKIKNDFNAKDWL